MAEGTAQNQLFRRESKVRSNNKKGENTLMEGVLQSDDIPQPME